MRLADLLVDLAAVASASRSVASKHVALRAGQIERYKRTSSVVTTFRTGKQTATQQSEGKAPGNPDAAGENVAEEGCAPASEEEVSGLVKDEGGKVGEIGEVKVGDGAVAEGMEAVKGSVAAAAAGGGREFRPAPWATRLGVTRQSVQPRSSFASRLNKEPIQVPLVGEEEREGSALGQVDVGVFRTRRGQEVVGGVKGRSGREEAVPGSGKAAVEKRVEEEAVEEKVIEEKVIEEVNAAKTVEAEPVTQEDVEIVAELAGTSAPKYELRESRVPSSRIGRLWNYGGLAAGMFAGAVGEGLSRAVGGGSGSGGSVMLSPANMERLVAKLSRMRGAALKMGQMMSFQDAKMLPGPIQEVLQRVQDRADYMPAWQRDRVLTANLGPEWRDLFGEFEEKPIAAASIGQVHRATLKSTGARVAVKIQFPGVADSINSDLDNLSVLLAAANLLPKGLYLNKTIDNARTELAWECDYEREAECAARYRKLLTGVPDEAVFAVPKIYPEASGKHVLTMEFMDGVGVTRINSFTQQQRDWIGTQILRLCLREITEFRFMQTDPNWTNFLYNASKDRLELLDFGASREYPLEFITKYIDLLEASSRSDRDRVKELSEELGYLTGHESKAMLDAHIMSVMTLAEPFMQSAPEVYDFRDQTITERVKAQIPVMIRERLAPPPEETYSLHRKLSGAFLLCARLGSRVRCRELFEQALLKVEALGAAKQRA